MDLDVAVAEDVVRSPRDGGAKEPLAEGLLVHGLDEQPAHAGAAAGCEAHVLVEQHGGRGRRCREVLLDAPARDATSAPSRSR